MKKVFLFATLLITSAFLYSCTCSDNRNSNRDYLDDMKNALALESTPMDIAPEVDWDNVDLSKFMKYEGFIGDEGITLYYQSWNERSDELKDSGYCGFLSPKEAPFKFPMKEISNEPNPGGFNHVILEIYRGDELYATLEGDIQGRGDGFDGTITYVENGEKKQFELMQKY